MTLGLTAVLFAFPALAHASSIPFNVSPIYPDNQIQNEGFYYLKMTPGQEETVNVTLSNTSSKPVTIDIETATAKTDSAGFVGYMPLTNIPKDSSLKYDLTQYMKAAPKVTIPAGTSKNVPVTIEMLELVPGFQQYVVEFPGHFLQSKVFFVVKIPQIADMIFYPAPSLMKIWFI